MRIVGVLLLMCFGALGDTFNFEISSHVLGVVKKIMDVGTWPHRFSFGAFQAGFYDPRDRNTSLAVFYYLLRGTPQAYSIYAGYEDGTFISVIQGDPNKVAVLKNLYNLTGNFMASYRPPGVNRTRDYYETDKFGQSTTFLRSVLYDHRLRPWYQQTKALGNVSHWEGPYIFASLNESGMTFCIPIYNGTTFDGVLALDFSLADISQFLATQYPEPETRLVYIVDWQGYLIGNSKNSYLLRNGSDILKASASGDAKLTAILNRNVQQDALVIVEDEYIQTIKYRDSSTLLDWTIIVIMPANPSLDFVRFSHSGAIPIIVVSVLAAIVSVVHLVALIKYRDKKIVKASNVTLVAVFLVGCFFLNISFVALLGDNSPAACRFRAWWPNLMFTIAFAPILVKTFILAELFLAKGIPMPKLSVPRFSRTWWRQTLTTVQVRVFILVLIEVLILLIGTAALEFDPYAVTVLGPDGAYQTRVRCGPQGSVGAISVIDQIYHILMLVVGCVIAWKTRNLKNNFVETWSMGIIVYSIAIIGLILLVVLQIAPLTAPSRLLLLTIGLNWSTIVSTVVLLVPRFWKMYTIGDEGSSKWLERGWKRPGHSTTASGDFGTQSGHARLGSHDSTSVTHARANSDPDVTSNETKCDTKPEGTADV